MKRACFLLVIVILSGLLCGAFGLVQPVERPRGGDEFARSLSIKAALNPVAVIAYDFRSFDTLLTVGCLFASVCSVGSLFRDRGRRE